MIYPEITAEKLKNYKSLSKLEQIRAKDIISEIKTKFTYLNVLTNADIHHIYCEEMGEDTEMPKHLMAITILSHRFGEDRVEAALKILKLDAS